jgi:hypothetical protein
MLTSPSGRFLPISNSVRAGSAKVPALATAAGALAVTERYKSVAAKRRVFCPSVESRMFDKIGIELLRSATECVRARPRKSSFLLMVSSMANPALCKERTMAAE